VTRSRSSANGKRKRCPSPPPTSKAAFERTPLTCLYVQGLDKDQIWAQLELRAQGICKMLESALEGTEEPSQRCLTTSMDKSERDSQEEENESELSYEESDGDSETNEETDESSGEQLSLEEGVTGLRDRSADKEEEGLTGESYSSPSTSPPRTKAGHLGLNDDFFNLEEFNAETEEAEADFVSNGALDADSDDMASDDDIDYFASVDGQLHVDDDHGESIAPSVVSPRAKYWSY
jgi:U3 small nucleolar RNA-associated protein MPP10